MPVFEVCIVEKPTEKEKDEGGTERMILSPTAVLAKDAQAAAIGAVMDRKLEVARRTRSVSPLRQSLTSPMGCASCSGVSIHKALKTISLTGLGKCFSASFENFLAMILKASQSSFASQGG